MPSKRKAGESRGTKMIVLSVRFWTDDIAQEEGSLRPKHAWSSGWVKLEPNPTHGIRSGKIFMFNSLLGLGTAIEKSLIDGGIRLHPSRKTTRYAADPSD